MQISWISSFVSGLGLLLAEDNDNRKQCSQPMSGYVPFDCADDALVSPWAVAPLPVGTIKPSGWLLQEMQTIANGLAGHEYDFYVYVKTSRWLCPQGSTEGTDYSNLNEGLPYWFNSMVPLAYTLDDGRLKGQVHTVAEKVLSLQTEDGYLGPENVTERNVWARTPLLLGLTQLVDANSTWEQPVLTSMRKYMTLINQMLHANGKGFTDCSPEIDCRWGQARISDLYITIQWMLEKYPSQQDSLLWDTMRTFDKLDSTEWDSWYDPNTYPKVVDAPSPKMPDFLYNHAVNVGQVSFHPVPARYTYQIVKI